MSLLERFDTIKVSKKLTRNIQTKMHMLSRVNYVLDMLFGHIKESPIGMEEFVQPLREPMNIVQIILYREIFQQISTSIII